MAKYTYIWLVLIIFNYLRKYTLTTITKILTNEIHFTIRVLAPRNCLIIKPPRIVLISATPDIAEYGATWTTKYDEAAANNAFVS